jgi:serine/threonine protein kinase
MDRIGTTCPKAAPAQSDRLEQIVVIGTEGRSQMDRIAMSEQTIFIEALDKLDRAAYLDEACGGDEVLRRRVESLLARYDEDPDFLEDSPIHRAALDMTIVYNPDSLRNGDPNEPLPDFLRPSAKANCLGTLGPYEITRIIGWGGMGVVLEARDPILPRSVAVKVLAPKLAANRMARKRFLREAKTAAAVVHPHVVTLHTVGLANNVPYLVMEWVDGVSLHQKLKELGPLELKEILRIGSQIAEGLAAIHRQGLIHRDIKPSNIQLGDRCRHVKITDFGLARAVNDRSLTLTGEVAGTPMFMSPEQAAGKHIDHRTDLFSLGSVLYTMCTGRTPFPDDSLAVVMKQVRDGTPCPIRELKPEIPEWLIKIIDRLRHKNPDDRFQTAQEVSDLLGKHLDELQYRDRSQCENTELLHEPGNTIRETQPSTTGAPESTISWPGSESKPGSLDRFLKELRLVHPGRIDELVARLWTEKGPPDAARVAHELVRDEVLTPYQAAALYQGKGKELLVGPYVVLDKIGTGGMGIVFKAVHRKLRKVVALKVLPRAFQRRKPGVEERFRSESEALARLKHPNIVCCHEPVQEVGGVHYIVLEYIQGKDLRFLVENKGLCPVAQAIECVLQTAKGLQSAHALKIIHRDIKPANLMLDRNTRTVRILDFGLARVRPLDPFLIEVEDSPANRAILGTIPYMSPEQITDPEKADERSDIYSLGCTLHFLLTGRPPYQGRTAQEMVRAHRQDPIPSLKAARPSVPDYLDGLFRRMLAKDPADRPPTMASVIASLELAMEKSSTRPPSSHTIPVRPPDESGIGPIFSLDDLEIESLEKFRSDTKDRSEVPPPPVKRIEAPDGPWDFNLLAKCLLLAGALTAVIIILIKLIPLWA